MKYEITKGAKEDFELAPEWATLVVAGRHYSKAWISHYANGARALAFSTKDEYVIEAIHDCEIIAERRPITEPVWDGEGVPCVGQKVMTKSGEGIIDYVGSGVIVYSNNDGQWSVRCDSLDYSLSAIRSPEDVARDEAIDDLVETMIYFYGNPKGAESYRGLAVRIIEAIEIGKISRIKME